MKRRLLWAALGLALVLALTATSCVGKDGTVTGAITWPSGYGCLVYSDWSSSGFPSTATKGVQYAFTPGSYYFHYSLYDSYYLYSYMFVSYTVSVNKGKLFADGANKAFTIYCYSGSASITGLNIVETTPKGIQGDNGETIKTYTDGVYTITLKYSKDNAPAGVGKALKE